MTPLVGEPRRRREEWKPHIFPILLIFLSPSLYFSLLWWHTKDAAASLAGGILSSSRQRLGLVSLDKSEGDKIAYREVTMSLATREEFDLVVL